MPFDKALLLSLGLALSGAVFASLYLGAAPLSWAQIFSGLIGVGDEKSILIIQQIRLPRTLLALLAGGVLGISGAALQGYLRNPLAEPGLIGTSASAGLGAVVALYFGWGSMWAFAVPVSAIITAGVAMLLLIALIGRSGSATSLILAGAALSALAAALISLAMNLSPNPYALSEIVLWLLGSVRDRSMDDVLLVLPFVGVGVTFLIWNARALDALALGHKTAHSMGVRLEQVQLSIILGVALSTGAIVSVVGSVGFVGLVVPHVLRPWLRLPSKLLLPSAFGGAFLLTVADCLVRLVPTQTELMLGVVTALIGTPFFLYLIKRYQREGI